jgi:uncharacterized protein (UPF0261 family)
MRIKVLRHVGSAAMVLTAAAVGSALGQTDIIGVTPISQDAVVAIKAIAVGGICFGFLRMMSGRHTVEGLVEMGVGGLGIAKATAITAAFGF